MEKVHGGDIYSYEKNIVDFSANINPLGIEGEVAKAISNSVSAASVYPDTEYRKLREAISEIENVSPEYIVCGKRGEDARQGAFLPQGAPGTQRAHGARVQKPSLDPDLVAG